MKKVVNVQISQSEGGYVAESLDLPIVSRGATLDELVVNIREAVELMLADGDDERFGVVRHPSIAVNLIVDNPEYA